jgi:BioD-like phosphotransacetylase family protein
VGVIQVVSNHPGAGKTCLIGALLLRLSQQGRKVAYYKPFSTSPEADPDVAFIASNLLAGDGSPQVPVPQPIPQPGESASTISDQRAQQIHQSISALTADVVLVEGPELPLAAQLLPVLQVKAIMVVQYEKGLNAEGLSSLVQPIRDSLAGVVINSFPVHRKRQVEQGLVSALRGQGLPVLGAIPDDRTMLAVTVQQIADYLGGRWVQEPENTDAYIDRFLIGGNIMDSGPNYFGRYQHQAVITRAGRPDIQMASLMCDTKCLVLTGGAQPTEYVRVEASQRGVPLILVDTDTISTAESLNGLLEQANSYSMEKIRWFADLVQDNLDETALGSVLE